MNTAGVTRRWRSADRSRMRPDRGVSRQQAGDRTSRPRQIPDVAGRGAGSGPRQDDGRCEAAQVSALALLMPVDGGLDRGFRLRAGRRVPGFGVRIAPVAQLVRVAPEMWVDIARHQLVAFF